MVKMGGFFKNERPKKAGKNELVKKHALEAGFRRQKMGYFCTFKTN